VVLGSAGRGPAARFAPGPPAGPGAPGARLSVGRVQAFRRLALDTALAELVPALEVRGVRPLLLKGAAFAGWLYDEPRDRPYDDIDLLVAPEQFEDAERGLAELGYAPRLGRMHLSERSDHSEEWTRDGMLPIAVELHHSLKLLPGAPAVVWERLSSGAGTIEVAGRTVGVPAEPAAALIVALHAAQHGREFERSMTDLRQALDRLPFTTWQAAAALAAELDVAAAFGAGLRLAPGGPPLCERLGLDETAPRHVRLSASTPPKTAMGIERLLTTRGAGARLRIVVGALFPSREYLLATSAVARQGRLGLARAYLWRPFQLVGLLPRGLRAWAHAAARGGRRDV
jgi:hypothetical protein